MVKISVAIITLNEERNIGRCLESVKDIADDIVVVDSFSTDRTEEICLKYGARFFPRKWEGYVNTKNIASGLALFDHILSLDADEALSDELIISIKKVKESFSSDAYSMNRLTNYCGRWIWHSGWYPDKKLRLYNRRKGQWKGLIIHEELKMKSGSKVEHLPGNILHFSFYTVDEHRKQSEKFTTLGAEADYRKGEKAPFYKLWFAPAFKFIQSYFFKLGFLDGKEGYTICRLSAEATFQKYSKLKKHYQQLNEKA
jgi:glycosyltransferase involved in cell wall biosynthesis